MGQQLALTRDLGRLYPSEGLRIFGFAKEKGGNTTKIKQEQGNKETKIKERKLTRKHKGTKCNYGTIQGLPIFNLQFDRVSDPNH